MPTLFAFFAVECEYGSIRNKSYTGIKKRYFNSIAEAKKSFFAILTKKLKKGYKIK